MTRWDELQKLHDGELAPAEAARLESSLGPDDRARLGAMAQVGEAVRASLEQQAAGARLDVWSAIASKLDDRGGAQAPIAVLSRRRRWLVRAVVGSAASLAAGLLLYMWRPSSLKPTLLLGGPIIEQVDFSDQAGVVYQIHDAQTTVIWQTEEE